jgi:type I restriction enzyme S subunit
MVTYPSEWKEKALGDFISIGRGASPRPIESFLTSSPDGVNWIKIGDAPKYGMYITRTAERITPAGAIRSVRVHAGDFILSNSMSFGRPYILKIDGCIHDGWLRLYDYNETVDRDFLFYVLASDETKKQYVAYAAGSGVQNLNKDVVKKVIVHLPTVKEQKAIAASLSSFDEYISDLAALIEKKKAIREGAVADLMTGKTRLAGYTAPWASDTLGAIGTFTKGAPLSKAAITETGTPFILYGELYTTYGEVTYVVHRHTKQNAPADCISRVGDVIIPTSGETADEIATACCVMVPGVILAGDLNIYRAPEMDGRFISHVINHVINRKIAEVAQGISIIHINAKVLGKMAISYPQREEQSAIADVIDKMDTEIRSLEAEREKMIQIREGAMNDLLTGRVRLSL